MRRRTQVPPPGHWDADGVIAYAGISRADHALGDFLRACRVPKVWLHADRDVPQTPVVAVDKGSVGEIAAQHLLSLHLRHFAFVQFDESPMERRRREGFEIRLATEGPVSQVMNLREFIGRFPVEARFAGAGCA